MYRLFGSIVNFFRERSRALQPQPQPQPQLAFFVWISQLPDITVLDSMPISLYFYTGEKLYYYNSDQSIDVAITEIALTPTQITQLNTQLKPQTVIDHSPTDHELSLIISNYVIQYKPIMRAQLKMIEQITKHTRPPRYPNLLFEFIFRNPDDNESRIRDICKAHPEYVVTRMSDVGERVAFGDNTPLIWAIANSKVKAALILLDSTLIPPQWMNQQINQTDGEKTPLIFSIQKGWSHRPTTEDNITWDDEPPQADIAKRLLALGADVNARDLSDGRTALHYAYLYRNIEAIETLLSHSADPTIRDRHGQTPEDMLKYSVTEAEQILASVSVFTLDKTQWLAEKEIVFHEQLQRILSAAALYRV